MSEAWNTCNKSKLLAQRNQKHIQNKEYLLPVCPEYFRLLTAVRKHEYTYKTAHLLILYWYESFSQLRKNTGWRRPITGQAGRHLNLVRRKWREANYCMSFVICNRHKILHDQIEGDNIAIACSKYGEEGRDC